MCIKSVEYYSSLSQDVLSVAELWLIRNKQNHVKRTIADVEACSLYHSAMHYMDGFLEDKPKLLNDKPYEFLTSPRWVFHYN